MMSRISTFTAALVLLAVAAPAAAQYMQDLPMHERQRLEAEARYKAESDARMRAEDQAYRQKLLRLPPLPDERNVLLGTWRLEAGGQGGGVTGLGQGKGTGGTDAMFRDLWATLQSNPGKLLCAPMFGNGITFASSTYSISALDGSVSRGSIAYRSSQKQVIVAIPANANVMAFDIADSNRIVIGESCPLVRVGAPAASAAANAPPPSTLSRPSPEVCRNNLLDKLGVVGTNQVRAMSDVRFKEAAIEGKVPNTNNLRIDLRGSACDDPRIKATLYDFDANGMLQSITYVWERPTGLAPAPIFSERVTQLSRFHSLPPAQSPGRLQADTSIGRLIIEDLPERNLLLEAYKAKK